MAFRNVLLPFQAEPLMFSAAPDCTTVLAVRGWTLQLPHSSTEVQLHQGLCWQL